jgi:hypothetical protein
MKLIRYIREAEVDIRDDCCIHLDEDTRLSGCDADVMVWLESYAPERVIAAAKRLPRPVLNSLWLDERYWKAYAAHLSEFSSIVLVPYDPQAQEQHYERNVSRLLALADRYAIPASACIVDLAILPYGRESDTSGYRERLEQLYAEGLRTVAAFDNYIHRAPDKVRLLRQLKEALADKLTYGIVRTRYYAVLSSWIGSSQNND